MADIVNLRKARIAKNVREAADEIVNLLDQWQQECEALLREILEFRSQCPNDDREKLKEIDRMERRARVDLRRATRRTNAHKGHVMQRRRQLLATVERAEGRLHQFAQNIRHTLGEGGECPHP